MYREELLWILDKIEGTTLKTDEEYQQNIDFVHSLGLKCDCVGWCKIDLGDSKTDEILKKIEEFCLSCGWKARGWYTRSYENDACEWFVIDADCFKDGTLDASYKVPCKNAESDTVHSIRAYRESTVSPKKWWATEFFVPARFVKACREIGVGGVDFCWLRDTGKYAAEQYFSIYPSQSIAHIGIDQKVSDNRTAPPKLYDEMGGWLAKVADLFYELNVKLPDCYLAEDMPSGGIAVARSSQKNILIHRELAEGLIAAKGLSKKYLRPAMVVERIPNEYTCVEALPLLIPTDEFSEQNRKEYENFLTLPHPARKIGEKEALKKLRAAKRDRKDDFCKAFQKAKLDQLSGTPYASLSVYYQISNGGYLSDEYRFLPYPEALTENTEFKKQLEREELLTEKPDGVIIAKCADSDAVLLLSDGRVIRFSHEEPAELESWSTLAQFIYEALSDD